MYGAASAAPLYLRGHGDTPSFYESAEFLEKITRERALAGGDALPRCAAAAASTLVLSPDASFTPRLLAYYNFLTPLFNVLYID